LAYFVLDCQPERDVLLTGAFANVRLELPNPEAAIHVPASAHLRPEGPARRDRERRRPHRAQTGDDLARPRPARSRSAQASRRRDRIVESPSDGIGEGDQVRIAGKPGAGNAAENAAQRRRKL
jgi:hypothetical protein